MLIPDDIEPNAVEAKLMKVYIAQYEKYIAEGEHLIASESSDCDYSNYLESTAENIAEVEGKFLKLIDSIRKRNKVVASARAPVVEQPKEGDVAKENVVNREESKLPVKKPQGSSKDKQVEDVRVALRERRSVLSYYEKMEGVDLTSTERAKESTDSTEREKRASLDRLD